MGNQKDFFSAEITILQRANYHCKAASARCKAKLIVASKTALVHNWYNVMNLFEVLPSSFPVIQVVSEDCKE